MSQEIATLRNELAQLNDTLQVERKQYRSLEEKYRTKEADYHALEERYRLLDEKHRTLVRKFFGKRSEKITPEEETQGRLFNESEDGNDRADEGEREDRDEIITVSTHTRKKRGRKPIPDDIPREEIVHDLSDDEKRCPCCGEMRPLIGTEDSEELDIVPAKVVVLRHIKKKYGPCRCDGFFHSGKPEVIAARMPERMLPGSIASHGLLAYAITAKFADALPFYRQSKIFERIGVDISRATMCNWAIGVSERMSAFFEVFIEEMKTGEFMRMDETTVQVLHEEGRPPDSKSYMWVAIGYPVRGKPLVLYQYHPSRSQNIPNEFLEGFSGYLQTDGYGGYTLAASREDIVHVGCFAHARRYFFDAAKLNKKDSRAHKALGYILKLYEIERKTRERMLTDDAFVEARKKETSPVLEEFHSWLLGTEPEIVPSSRTHKGIRYTLDDWEKLIRYCDAAFLTPDNNECERAIRPFVIGRKNWLCVSRRRTYEENLILTA